MKMRDFFESFDPFFSVYDSIELTVQNKHGRNSWHIITTDDAVHYNNMWWKNFKIVYFCFDSDNVLYIVAEGEN